MVFTNGRNSCSWTSKSAFACGLVLLYYSFTPMQNWQPRRCERDRYTETFAPAGTAVRLSPAGAFLSSPCLKTGVSKKRGRDEKYQSSCLCARKIQRSKACAYQAVEDRAW